MTPVSRTWPGPLAVALAACSWGTWPLFLRTAERYGPMPAALESCIVMIVVTIISGIATLRDHALGPKGWLGWLAMVWLGISDAGNVAALFRAYSTTSVAVAVLTHYLAPVFVTLGASAFLGERWRLKNAVGTFVAFFGLVLLLEPWRAVKTTLSGAAFGALSAVFYASNVLIGKRLIGRFSPSEVMFYHGLISAPLLALLVPKGVFAHANGASLGIMLAGALLPGSLGALAFMWGLARTRATVASTLTFLEPIVAVLVGWLVYHERLSWLATIGGALVACGIVSVVVERRSGR